ncbi:hypothetical protein, partial [Jonquetella anthropi]|uniref:hypothetical protein n=1 Tax=Jonquetella anthropi TaxID=428712 RepID=UPI0023F56F86
LGGRSSAHFRLASSLTLRRAIVQSPVRFRAASSRGIRRAVNGPPARRRFVGPSVARPFSA